MFEDEASFWLDGTLHQTWARVGVQPRVDTYGARKTAHVFGAVSLGEAAFAYEFVDVFTLFGFAADKVPELARDIGGVQRPIVASPKGGASFDIGRLTKEDKAKVPLQAVRPVQHRRADRPAGRVRHPACRAWRSRNRDSNPVRPTSR